MSPLHYHRSFTPAYTRPIPHPPQAVELIRQTTNDLIRKCREMVDEEEYRAASAAAESGQVWARAGGPVWGREWRPGGKMGNAAKYRNPGPRLGPLHLHLDSTTRWAARSRWYGLGRYSLHAYAQQPERT